jgi:hypothetical protein
VRRGPRSAPGTLPANVLRMKSGTCRWGSRSLLACVALSFAPGCSYLLVSGPPAEHERLAYFDCTTSRAAPIEDAVVALAHSGTALAAMSLQSLPNHSGSGGSDGVATAEIAVLGLAAVGAASAGYGFYTAAKCDRAEEQWQMRMMQAPARTGCGNDAQCKSGRRCVQRLCVGTAAPPATTLGH